MGDSGHGIIHMCLRLCAMPFLNPNHNHGTGAEAEASQPPVSALWWGCRNCMDRRRVCVAPLYMHRRKGPQPLSLLSTALRSVPFLHPKRTATQERKRRTLTVLGGQVQAVKQAL